MYGGAFINETIHDLNKVIRLLGIFLIIAVCILIPLFLLILVYFVSGFILFFYRSFNVLKQKGVHLFYVCKSHL